MRLLFITTFNKSITVEHYFTRNVWKHLQRKNVESVLATIYLDTNIESPRITEDNVGFSYYKLYIPSLKDYEAVVGWISELYQVITPTIIHSNMIEGYDVDAARIMNLNIVLTVHIGGFLCPRGGLNGFLMYNDQICDTVVSDTCMRCTSKELPCPKLSYLLQRILPDFIKCRLLHLLANRSVFYLTQFLGYYEYLKKVRSRIDLFNYATIIVANYHLDEIFKRNGLNKTYLLPHGVESRKHYPFPVINDKIKFFYLGRIQYAKGIHLMLEAFSKIDKMQYELHIIGWIGSQYLRREMVYFEKIKKMSEGLNVFFHGELPNDKIDMLIQDFHVMIHPAICMEVYGITISESLSIGRPVLATRCGGAEMQIKDNYNGWLIPTNDAVAMYDKIDYIIKHPQVVKEVAIKCDNPFTLDSYIDELIKLYNMQIHK